MLVKELQILLDIDKVKSFINCNSSFDGDIDVISDRYIIDGKSIMGVFSLDLSKELTVKLTYNSEEEYDKLIASYKCAKLI